jgi:hypothetical protein
MKKSILASGILGAASLVALLGCTPPVACRAAGRRFRRQSQHRRTADALAPRRQAVCRRHARRPLRRRTQEPARRAGVTVLSVDGVNVLTGQTAATLQSGYVIDGGQSYAINGWRKSMEDVAQFVFTALPDSYAARTGRPGNVGVIGVAVYRERAAPPQPIALAPQVTRTVARRIRARSRVTQPVRFAEWRSQGGKAWHVRRRTIGPPRPVAMAERRAEQVGSPLPMPRSRTMKLGTGHGRARAFADALHGVRPPQRYALTKLSRFITIPAPTCLPVASSLRHDWPSRALSGQLRLRARSARLVRRMARPFLQKDGSS